MRLGRVDWGPVQELVDVLRLGAEDSLEVGAVPIEDPVELAGLGRLEGCQGLAHRRRRRGLILRLPKDPMDHQHHHHQTEDR